jgi:hypothetical protein
MTLVHEFMGSPEPNKALKKMQDSVKSLYWDQALRRTQVYEFIQKVKANEKI